MKELFKRYGLITLFLVFALILSSAIAYAQDATEEPTAVVTEEPPPVEDTEVQEAVEEVTDATAAQELTPQDDEGFLAELAEDFIALFQRGADTFVGLVTGIVPLLIILMTAVNALIALIGPDRIERIGEIAGRPGLVYYPIRYIVLPFLSVFFLTNPMAYTMGRFLPEKFKPAFYDSAVSFVHPPLGLFPHINPGEYFVWGGIAVGITQLGLGLGDLAVRYFLVGLIVIFIRGVLTERITAIMWSQKTEAEA